MTAAMAVSPAVQISPAFQVAHNRDKLISPQVRMPRAKNIPSLREVFKKDMEIFNAICHEGGGASHVPLTFFLKIKFFVKNHLESFPDCQNVLCT